MKTKVIAKVLYVPATWITFATIVFLLVSTRPIAAQYTLDNTYSAWSGYNGQFLFTYSSGEEGFSKQNGGSSSTGFWEDVEEIEVAEDAYYWSINNYPTHDHSAYITEINDLCVGFAAHNKFHTSNNDWSGDTFNDDLSWAAIAFARAYQITGNSTWLSAAKKNFTTVWNRAQAGNGGLYQVQGGTNEDAPVNFAFVIAGYLLYNNTGTASYKTEADTVYTWAMANLYQTTVDDGAGPGVCVGHTSLTCAKIYDGTSGHTDYTYNYGIAIQAATREGDFTKAQYIANWLMYNFNNPNFPYAGTHNGYNVLPNWGPGGTNNDGYNGIAMRGVGFGYSRGALNATTLAWAQANLNEAWSHKNSSNVMEENWTASTPGSPTYAWDCSSALTGMLVIPPPGS